MIEWQPTERKMKKKKMNEVYANVIFERLERDSTIGTRDHRTI